MKIGVKQGYETHTIRFRDATVAFPADLPKDHAEYLLKAQPHIFIDLSEPRISPEPPIVSGIKRKKVRL